MLTERNFFTRQNRITESKQFGFLFASAKKFYFTGFSLFVKRTDCGVTRIGVVVSKKNEKLAVKRNKIKRAVRESFRHNKKMLQGLEIIFVARREIKNQKACEFRKGLSNAWSKGKKC